MNDLSHPEFAPKHVDLGTSKKLIVLIHGLGSDGHDLIALAPYMRDELPNYHFFSPHGIEAYDMAPFGRQWFSLKDRNPEKIQKLLEDSAPKLIAMIKSKQQQLNLTDNDTVIVGFSQGAMIGSYITSQISFNCFIGFSGRVTHPETIKNYTTPYCLIHGEDDSVITIDELHKGEQYLNKQQIPHEVHALKNLTHSIDARGLSLAVKFIKKYEHSSAKIKDNQLN